MSFSLKGFSDLTTNYLLLSIENSEGSISFMRGCGWSDTRTEWCILNNVGAREFKSCYKTCNTPLCNHVSMDETFPSFSINCVHCSSYNQPWCLDESVRDHFNDLGVTKKCWNGRCLTTRNGKLNMKIRL